MATAPVQNPADVVTPEKLEEMKRIAADAKRAAAEERMYNKESSKSDEPGQPKIGKKKGGCVKMAKGGSASSRGDGIAQRGKTRGRMV